jgi:riboflavin synthase
MFTGIIECLGQVEQLQPEGTNLRIQVSAPIAHQFSIDQSVAHNGVCLTVDTVDTTTGRYSVVAVLETLRKSNLGGLELGHYLNLERCISSSRLLDGHIVQGHVDSTGVITSIQDRQGSWDIVVEYPTEYAPLLVPKGSICVNGVSLTVVDVTDTTFSFTVIPYTFEHTTFHRLATGETVNLEFDIIGKYIQRQLQPYLARFTSH